MARVYSNWDRLVRATLRREQLKNTGQSHERVNSGLAGAVPPSLGRATNIDAILQAADEIQSEDPNVARIRKFFVFFFFSFEVSSLCLDWVFGCGIHWPFFRLFEAIFVSFFVCLVVKL